MGSSTSVPRSDSSLLRAQSRSSFARLLSESEANLGGYSLGVWFRLVQIVVLSCRLVTPLSYALLLCGILVPITPEMVGGNIPFALLALFCLAEALFFPFYLWKFNELGKFRNLVHYANCRDSRSDFFRQCMDAMTSAVSSHSALASTPELYLRKAVSGWFFDTPIENIHFENFKSWVACYFFNKHLHDLSEENLHEAGELTRRIEEKLKMKFLPGGNDLVLSARLHLDPIFSTQRPFFIYVAVFFINLFTHLALRFIGFRKSAAPSSQAQNIYVRRATQLKKKKRSSGNAEEKEKVPVVFIHGLGIGFAHYFRLINHMPKDVDVYLLEWPHVAMQLSEKVPTIEETKEVVSGALLADGHKKACFVGHSLGNTVISWFLRDRKYASFVHSSVQLDPVTYLLCDPTVATVFVYKNPQSLLALCMHFFLSRELYTANALQRHFSWSHNICFAEDLLPLNHPKNSLFTPTEQTRAGAGAGARAKTRSSTVERNNDSSNESEIRHTIILSSHDNIVPVGPVSRYLEVKKEAFQAKGCDCFETMMFHGHHAEMLLYPTWLKIIKNRIRKHYEVGSDATADEEEEESRRVDR